MVSSIESHKTQMGNIFPAGKLADVTGRASRLPEEGCETVVLITQDISYTTAKKLLGDVIR